MDDHGLNFPNFTLGKFLPVILALIIDNEKLSFISKGKFIIFIWNRWINHESEWSIFQLILGKYHFFRELSERINKIYNGNFILINIIGVKIYWRVNWGFWNLYMFQIKFYLYFFNNFLINFVYFYQKKNL